MLNDRDISRRTLGLARRRATRGLASIERRERMCHENRCSGSRWEGDRVRGGYTCVNHLASSICTSTTPSVVFVTRAGHLARRLPLPTLIGDNPAMHSFVRHRAIIVTLGCLMFGAIVSRSATGQKTPLPNPDASFGFPIGTDYKLFDYEQSIAYRSEEHTSELQSPCNLVCRLLLEKKNTLNYTSVCKLR